MKSIAIIDYGSGNIYSLKNALKYVGLAFEVVSAPTDLIYFDTIILPGVGAFESCMNNLQRSGFASVITQQAHDGKKILGVCVGMQLFFDKSYEFGVHEGLGIISGNVEKLPDFDSNLRPLLVPHVGWAKLRLANAGRRKCKKPSQFDYLVDTVSEYYFVHSYAANPKNSQNLVATADYGGFPIAAVVQSKNVVGFQFHPEKSGECGLDILKRWARD